jgi:hypothetical protein
MGGACSAWGEMRNVYRIFVGKHEGKRPLQDSAPWSYLNVKEAPM